MEQTFFTKVLLDVAVCAISCDGHIDDLEIKELHEIQEKSPYFIKDDLKESLNNSISLAIDSYEIFQKRVFSKLNEVSFDIIQELSILEISFALINADNKIDESEIIFINNLRKCLSVEDFIIKERFGDVSYLEFNNSKKSEFNKPPEFDL